MLTHVCMCVRYSKVVVYCQYIMWTATSTFTVTVNVACVHVCVYIASPNSRARLLCYTHCEVLIIISLSVMYTSPFFRRCFSSFNDVFTTFTSLFLQVASVNYSIIRANHFWEFLVTKWSRFYTGYFLLHGINNVVTYKPISTCNTHYHL